MIIDDIIKLRSITEVLHFTTNQGILGILDAKAVKARDRLGDNERLEYIFMPNTKVRRHDHSWTDYVNLSLSRINSSFFSVSAGAWHKAENLWWCILSFSSEILKHDGVYFTTTNNIYPSTKREMGADALESLFAPEVSERFGAIKIRPANQPKNYTTCEQAEVLYPGELSIDFLKKIYVRDGDSADQLAAQIYGLVHQHIPIEVNPSYFGSMS